MADTTEAETQGATTEAAEATEPAEAAETAQVTEGSEDKTPVETPEGKAEEAKEGEKAEEKQPEIPEDVLKAAALKYAKEQQSAANKTMAAARRAEKAAEAVKAENGTLKQQIGEYQGFVQDLRGPNPMQALARIGFKTFREFAEHVRDADGGEVKTPSAEERIDAWERRQKEREEREEQARIEAKVTEAKQAVFAAIDAAKDRFVAVATRRGKAELWEAIEAYHRLHGDVPDEAVMHLADELEKDLRSEFGIQIPGTRPAETKTDVPAATQAASAARTGGKTMTNRSTAGAPVVRELPLDEDERRAAVIADMRAAGEL